MLGKRAMNLFRGVEYMVEGGREVLRKHFRDPGRQRRGQLCASGYSFVRDDNEAQTFFSTSQGNSPRPARRRV
jgi:hypothetical protein